MFVLFSEPCLLQDRHVSDRAPAIFSITSKRRMHPEETSITRYIFDNPMYLEALTRFGHAANLDLLCVPLRL